MAGGLNVALMTPTERLAVGRVEAVVAPGGQGELTLLEGHVALVAALAPGIVSLEGPAAAAETEAAAPAVGGRAFFITGGLLEVQANEVLLLVDAAEPLAALDVDQAARALKAAEAAVGRGKPEAREAAAAALALAQAREQAAQRALNAR